MREFHSKLSIIYREGLEVSILDLERMCELDPNDHLGNLQRLSEIFEDLRIKISPPLTIGGFEENRNLHSRGSGVNILDLISEGEGNQVEFKSTAFLDKKKLQFKKDLPGSDYFSKDVLKSTLKTIAAFANCDGGKLLVGVEDNGGIYGIENDFEVLNIDSKDRWELKLRECIENNFYDGKTLNSFVMIEFYLIDNKTIAILSVTKRSRLSFYKDEKSSILFLRQGNKTVSIAYHEIQDYFFLEKHF